MLESLTAVSRADLTNRIDVAVAAKALDVERQQGEAVVRLIEDAAAGTDTGKSGGGCQNGCGGSLDLYA